jgi:prepilin peptidase CpaA
MNAWLIVFIVSVVCFTAAIVVTDIRYWRMPNWMTVPAFAAGVLFHAILGWVDGGGWGTLEHLRVSLSGFALGFGFMFVAWLMGAGGGGDVKFLGAIGAWLGFIPTFFVIALSAMVACVITLGLLLYRSTFRGLRGAVKDMTLNKANERTREGAKIELRKRKQLSPYAVSALIATWVVVALLSRSPNKYSRYWQSGSFDQQTTGTVVDKAS